MANGSMAAPAQSGKVTVPLSFEHLRDFLQNRMRMSHIYQPVMIRELLTKGGTASVRDIASAFLARDESQLEYYEQITKRMPGKVLANHGVVERSEESFQLALDPSSLSSDEREELIRLCDDAITSYLEERGASAYDHRRAALGYLSGSLRYEVLKCAGFRCELCGVSADERAIEVDHILPRKHGSKDDLTNHQALCFKCNANKGARDNEDFRAVRDGLDARQPSCILCTLPADRIIASNTLAVCSRCWPNCRSRTAVSLREPSPLVYRPTRLWPPPSEPSPGARAFWRGVGRNRDGDLPVLLALISAAARVGMRSQSRGTGRLWRW